MESKPNLGFNEKMSLFYPDQLWRLVPAPLDAWDTELQQFLRNTDSPFWHFVERLSDTTGGISLLFLSFFSVWFFLGERSRTRFFAGLRFALVFLAFLAISDFISHKFLKIPIGRLKPRVNAIIPNFYQALSFPSSHAFNMLFAWNLMRLHLRSQGIWHQNKKLKILLLATLPFIFVVSWSRIAMNEHYPLDVVGGWILGALVARILAPAFFRSLDFVFKKTRVPERVEA